MPWGIPHLSALLVATASLLALLFFPSASGVLCFFYFFLWTMWLAIAVLAKDWSTRRLIGLWSLIDFGLLLNLMALAPGLGRWHAAGGQDGHDVVLLIGYAPAVLPMALWTPSWMTKASFFGLERLMGAARAELVEAWLLMSCLAAVQCGIVAAIAQFIKHRFASMRAS